MPRLQTLPENQPAPNPITLDIDYCSICGGGDRNEDYALHDKVAGICVADGIGGAPLGDAFARLACHIAMAALREGHTASSALRVANAEVAKFATKIDSPGSGTALLVARPDCASLDVAWAGDVGLFALPQSTDGDPQSTDGDPIYSNLGSERRHGPLGIVPAQRHGTLTLPLEGIDKFAVCTNGAWRSVGVEGMARFLAEDASPTVIATHIALAHRTSHDSTALVAQVEAAADRQA